ncbi:hypothetical protein PUN28_002589 [Cardiocondyla obscurior]|uniref:Transmembrane protein n=1 Tax=Cardiocondyla obscurior TaxID=286306 RepID=A0AAW2GV57_9HYME
MQIDKKEEDRERNGAKRGIKEQERIKRWRSKGSSFVSLVRAARSLLFFLSQSPQQHIPVLYHFVSTPFVQHIRTFSLLHLSFFLSFFFF